MDVTREQVRDGLRAARYITNARVETALFLALVLEKPLLAEGPAGAGKTELAKVLAEMLHTDLVRLQCYEGLDEARALFEWNYQKQLLRIQADRAEGRGWDEVSHHIFSREFLLERPLSRAITAPRVAPRRVRRWSPAASCTSASRKARSGDAASRHAASQTCCASR